MDQNDFDSMFEFGTSGEKVIGSWLQMVRVTHFALHPLDMIDHGPRVVMSDRTTVACPDFICWGPPPHQDAADDGQFFIEVKRFRKWWDDGGVQQTGIEESKVQEYRQLAAATSRKVYVYFLHLDELMRGDGLFYGEISAMTETNVTTPGGKRVLMFDKAGLVCLVPADKLAWHTHVKREDIDAEFDNAEPIDDDK